MTFTKPLKIIRKRSSRLVKALNIQPKLNWEVRRICKSRFLLFYTLYLLLETFPSNPTSTLKIPSSQKEINEKNHVWNQNVLQAIIVRKHGKITIWKQVWTPRHKKQIAFKI